MNLNKREISQTRFQETSMNLWELMLGRAERQVVISTQNRLIQIYFSFPFCKWCHSNLVDLCMPTLLCACTSIPVHGLILSITVNEMSSILMSVCLNF